MPSKIKKMRNKRKKPDVTETAIEDVYEQTLNDAPTSKRVKLMLPIKVNNQVIRRNVEYEEKEEEEEDQEESVHEEAENHTDDEDDENDSDGSYSMENDTTEPKTTVQLLAMREKSIRITREKIGVLCSNILEDPETYLDVNMRKLFLLMNECRPEVWLFVHKLTITSIMEVFKDILPTYAVREQNTKDGKLKKDTLKLVKYEEKLLTLYRKYLQKLDKLSSMLITKKGAKPRQPQELKLAEIAVQCMCQLLITHPHFNYSGNIVSVIVPFLIHSRVNLRETVRDCVTGIFRSDKKGTTTLVIVQKINALIKSKPHRITQDCLGTLLALNIRDVNLDQERDDATKEKKLENKKHKLIAMSKKERKRKKRMQELEKELLETRAEENQAAKQKCYTEITKIIFTIYFRVLKQYPNTGILSTTLEGLAKFAHLINLEYYTDLVNVINTLLKTDLGYKEQLHCILTVVTILYSHGDVFNIDPLSFYRHLFELLFKFHGGHSHATYRTLLQTLDIVLCKRFKTITSNRVLSFVKRLTTLALLTLHNSALADLNLVRHTMQLMKSVDVLLDTDQSVGDGVYNPENSDPEHMNASSTALWELTLLSRHYHPHVCVMADYICNGGPTSDTHNLHADLRKLTTLEFFDLYDCTEMAFHPAVPPPKMRKKVRVESKE